MKKATKTEKAEERNCKERSAHSTSIEHIHNDIQRKKQTKTGELS